MLEAVASQALVAELAGRHRVETDRDWSEKGISDNEKEYRAYSDRIAGAYRAGVKMAFGTDSGATPHGRGAEQFALMVNAGIEPLDAIRSATLGAAELLGSEKNVGRIAVGQRADLIAVAENPLAEISTLTDVRWVMKAGVVEKDRTTKSP